MAYSYKIRGLQTGLVFALDNATSIYNSFVSYTCRGFAVAAPQSKSNKACFVTRNTIYKNGPVADTQYSQPMKIYNPFYAAFLANTEQVLAIPNVTNPGMLAGAVEFVGSDLAPSFVFARLPNSQNNYRIYLSDSDTPNIAANSPRLVIDKVNSGRVLIVKGPVVATNNLDDVFAIDSYDV